MLKPLALRPQQTRSKDEVKHFQAGSKSPLPQGLQWHGPISFECLLAARRLPNLLLTASYIGRLLDRSAMQVVWLCSDRAAQQSPL